MIVLRRGRTPQPWSGLTRLWPYIAQTAMYNAINWARNFEFTTNPTLTVTRVATLMCPSEINDRASLTPAMFYHPTSCLFNDVSQFIYDPATDTVGDGVFVPNRAFNPSAIVDGLSNSVGLSEAKVYQPNDWGSRKPSTLNVLPPPTPVDLLTYLGGTFDSNGHTEWVEDDVHEVGFSTTFALRTFVLITVNNQPRHRPGLDA